MTTEPWKAASKLLQEYFECDSQEWPAFSASRLTEEVRVERDNRWQSDSHVELAWDILSRACFDVDDFATRFLGIDIDIESLRRHDETAGAPVFGLARPKSRRITVCPRSIDYKPLYRSTVLHEVAHIVLHGQEANRALAYSPRSIRRPPIEREADQFMHVALLPKSILRLAVALWCHYRKIHVGEPLFCADSARGLWQWRQLLFPTLISQLCVSRELISIKMRRLGLFSQHTLDYHRSYALPNRWLPQSRHKPMRRLMWSISDQLQKADDASE